MMVKSIIHYAAMAAGGLLHLRGLCPRGAGLYVHDYSQRRPTVQCWNDNSHARSAARRSTYSLTCQTPRLPAPQYGFIDTGGPHTPFAFNLAGTSSSGVQRQFLQPSGGTYTFGVFSLSTGDGDATPFGTFGISINSHGWQRLG